MTMRLRSSSMRNSAARLSLFSDSVRLVSSSICSCVSPYSSLHFWCKSFFLLSFRSSSDESGCGAVIYGFQGERQEQKIRGRTANNPSASPCPKFSCSAGRASCPTSLLCAMLRPDPLSCSAPTPHHQKCRCPRHPTLIKGEERKGGQQKVMGTG